MEETPPFQSAMTELVSNTLKTESSFFRCREEKRGNPFALLEGQA